MKGHEDVFVTSYDYMRYRLQAYCEALISKYITLGDFLLSFLGSSILVVYVKKVTRHLLLSAPACRLIKNLYMFCHAVADTTRQYDTQNRVSAHPQLEIAPKFH